MANWNARWSANECNDTLSRDPQKVYKKQGPKQQQQQRELDLWGIEDAHHLHRLDGERPAAPNRTRCENFGILLSVRFYVKSISENLEVLKLLLLPFFGL